MTVGQVIHYRMANGVFTTAGQLLHWTGLVQAARCESAPDTYLS